MDILTLSNLLNLNCPVSGVHSIEGGIINRRGKGVRDKKMTHKQSWWSRRYEESIEVDLANGKKLKVTIHKDGSSFWVNRMLVHPSNSESIEGVIREIGILYNSVVKEWKWLDY